MKIQIVTYAEPGSTAGNRVTAERWAGIFERLGHEATIVTAFDEGRETDLVVALHATRTHSSIRKWKSLNPSKPLIVCLTGTDLHVDLQGPAERDEFKLAVESLDFSDRVVLLEPEGINSLCDQDFLKRVRQKATVIFQAGERAESPAEPSEGFFDVTLIGHLREVKDPFRAAKAVKGLPDDSRILVSHYGEALTNEIKAEAMRLSESNPHYQWYGALSHEETLNRMAGSQLTLLTSRVEGAPGVISEAIVNGVPVLASRIPATIGMLGDDYEGLFSVGDTPALTGLLLRCEREGDFLGRLRRRVEQLAERFSKSVEVNGWRELLNKFD
jgi:putative glycosyltransferase (TIGR04348 family)